MKTQVKIVPISYRSVMHSKHFNLGVDDVVKNKGWNILYDTWTANKQWNYERGRLFAVYTKGGVPVKGNKKVTSEAIRAMFDGFIEKAIL
jgi:hypothetical protein